MLIERAKLIAVATKSAACLGLHDAHAIRLEVESRRHDLGERRPVALPL